jgi:hypothetical protein
MDGKALQGALIFDTRLEGSSKIKDFCILEKSSQFLPPCL